MTSRRIQTIHDEGRGIIAVVHYEIPDDAPYREISRVELRPVAAVNVGLALLRAGWRALGHATPPAAGSAALPSEALPR